MNYYIENNGKIVLFDTDRGRLEGTLGFMPQYEGAEGQETEREIVYRGESFEFADEIAQELLSDAKAARLAENRAAYEAALKSGVVYKDVLFDCDTLAAVRVMGQMVAAQTMAIEEEPSIEWFDYDYKPVTLTVDEFMELAGLITLNTRRIETLNCGFNTAIQAAASKEELEAVEIDYTESENG